MKTVLKVIKKYFILSQLYVLICIVIVPLTIAKLYGEKIGNETEIIPEAIETPDKTYSVGGAGLEDYLKGVVAAEMPAAFPLDALKAQAVASRTYAVRALENADHELEPADIGQAYVTQEQMHENWGENFDTYFEKISRAVDETAGEIMEYQGEPILAVFHSTSGGATETAGNIWNYDLPYLVSTESEGDIYAPNFETIKVMSAEEIIAALKAVYPDFEADAANLYDTIKIDERSEAGYVTKAEIAQKVLTGRQIREALGLRSSNFVVEKTEGGIAFKTKGYGHGAGMSQYGAKYMAENGADYLEILKHYYFDVQIADKNA